MRKEIPTKFWKIRYALEYHALYPVHMDDAKLLLKVGRESLKDYWHPVEVRLRIYQNEVRGDFSKLISGALTSNEKAKEVILPLIAQDVEMFPLASRAGDFFLFDIVRLENALNIDLSEIVYKADGHVGHVTKYHFERGALENRHIFKIAEEPIDPIFVSNVFKETVEQANLKGLEFHEVWADSDP